MAELGETADPRLLVPGDPDAARAVARSMIAFAGNLSQAGDGLARITTPQGWSGDGADAFRGRFAMQPPAWQDAGDAFTVASRALDVYAETLEWAQRQAAEAVRLFAKAQATTQRAASTPTDPGEVGRAQAHDILGRARGQLAAAGDDASRTLDDAAAAAPEERGFWDDVGDAVVDVGRDLVNGAASVGNAALHHPGDVAAMLAGGGLMALGGVGEVGGFALDATGVGAPAGVSLNIASAGLIATGAGIAGAGAISVAMNATGDDRVQPVGGGGEPPPFPQRPSAARPVVRDPRLDNIVRRLYRGADSPSRAGDGTTADAVRAERLTGGDVGGKHHITKANESVRALRNWLRRNQDASPEDRAIATNEMNNLLNALGRI
ncbi:hypothetical protein Acsp06_20590 [Actinomycetospora sp. NBRC 106375]|uniref:WXG100 family type VII secretion target n=1 Tax=Actinomycetospora sp. NBRC 106375 TaxID=3032207 RepID=UPI0024A2E39C|nr:hypothetical protein [Actinomycetospora sp. NBRC 106375]GLZ45874.1 hypothetical protein Acsp06_20590 [Actinomycetospora sp. NBRC 106375]